MTSIADKLELLKDDLKQCRNNIVSVGGFINASAGFKTVADEILNLDVVKSVGTLVDNSVALAKPVPLRSTQYAYLNSIGGMTYKKPEPDTFKITVIGDYEEYNEDLGLTFTGMEAEFEYVPAVPIVLTTEDVGGHYFCASSAENSNGTRWDTREVYINGDMSVAYTNQFDAMIPSGVTIRKISGKLSWYEQGAYPVGTVIECIPRIENTGWYPDYFIDPQRERLVYAKPTTIKSYPSNLLDFEAALKYWGATYTKEGEKYTITDIGNGNTHPYVFTDGIDVSTLALEDKSCENATYMRVVIGYYDGVSFTSRASILFRNNNAVTTATTNNRVNAITLEVARPSAEGYSFSFSNIRVSAGTEAKPFKPYKPTITYELPTAITDKLGLGYDANLFNEYSFVEGEAIERLNSTVISGTAGWFGVVNGRDRVGYALPSDALTIATGQTSIKANLITPCFGNDYSMSQLNNPLGYVWQVGGMIFSAGQYAWFFFPQGTFDTKEEAEAWFNERQLPIVYELADYVTTPITTDFNPLIEVDGGGSIEFVNEYNQPVPSTVTFQTIKS